MKTRILIFIILLSGLNITVQAQNGSDSLAIPNSKILHISTKAFNLGDTSNRQFDTLSIDLGQLMVLSLVDEKLFLNWEEQRDDMANKYSSRELVIIVSSEDTPQKMKFLKEFYQQLSNGKSTIEAYDSASKISTSLTKIKHAFYSKREVTDDR